jgi:FkbM family methyltransferase
MTVADVGANVGFHTVVIAREVGPSGEVHAFEPLPETVGLLRANVWRHGCDNVTLHEAAATDAPGTVSLELDPDGRSGAHLAEGGIEVAATTLDAALGGRRLDVLKLDVEGAEPLVLRGARDVLAASPALIAVVEFRAERHLDGSLPEAVLAEYEQLGFVLELLHADGSTRHASHDELLAAASAAGTLNIVLRRG